MHILYIAMTLHEIKNVKEIKKCNFENYLINNSKLIGYGQRATS